MNEGQRHCWVSVTTMPDAFNFGNRLIEYCLRRVLNLQSEEYRINAIQVPTDEQMEQVNACDYVVWPGVTLLQRNEHPGIERLRFAKPPAFCFGGTFFTRLILPSPAYARRLHRPVGARDTFAQQHLSFYGIPSVFVGCPTLFSGNAKAWKKPNGGPVVFCLGRKDIKAQRKVFDVIRRESPVRVVVQEAKQRACFPADTPFVEYDDVAGVIDAYATASVVVTGRLHAALPAIANGTPVVYSQLVMDSRLRLLNDIGLKIHNPYSKKILPLVRAMRAGRATPPDEIFRTISRLRRRFTEYVEEFRQVVSAA